MKRLVTALCLTGTLISGNALAWGDQGHRAIGAIADRLLKGTNAEKQIAALLLPGENLEFATIWADCVKGAYCGPQTQEMQDYIAANPQHTEYHYTNTPVQKSAYEQGGTGTSDHDIVQMLQQTIAVLQGRGDAQTNPHKLTPRQALLLLAHLASDIHQPMHVGSHYIDRNDQFVTPATQAEVDGVNIFDLRGSNNLFFADAAYDRAPWPNQPIGKQNLHFYWDITTVESVFKRAGVSTPAEFAQKTVDAKPDVYMNRGPVAGWPKQWADSSLTAAKMANAPLQPGARKTNVDRKGVTYYTWPVTVPTSYPEFATTLAGTQLVRGGYHFAAMLQQIWP
jgi:hypothetical protein